IGDVSPNGKYIEKTAEKIKPSGLHKTRQVSIGEFLLSNSMSFGRPYILKIDGCIHDGWLVLRGFQDVLEENFFYHLLRTEYVQSQFETSASGSTVRNLNTKSVESISIPLPPLDIQHEIVGKLEAVKARCERLKAEAERGMKAAEALRKAVLAEAFEQ
ncbi:MAG: restriction endonuclease subunit S, partial [Kiritimatiellae bacterium]|nr:restriction endonuclease subunit S [Kiritimatiellia bacterium]